MIFWVLTIAVSLAMMVVTAGAKIGDPNMAYAHMAVAGLTSLLFAAAGMREMKRLTDSGASRAAVAASSARSMSFLWIWGALALFLSYGFGIVEWHEWLHFFLAFVVAGTAALFFAVNLERDAKAGKADETILKLSRYLAWIQLVGMTIVVIGLLVDGKMTRFLVPRHGDWAANNIFFFGAIGLALISAYALMSSRQRNDQN